MNLPYHIATLLYIFNSKGQVLLLKRNNEPNAGLWSPCGGKLRMDEGESPYDCACREAKEELGWRLRPADLHLTGMISETGCEQSAHWLMFLFEVKPLLEACPPEHREGAFQFHSPLEISLLPIPETDKEQIWPLFWKHRGRFFAAHCQCEEDGAMRWTLEAGRPNST